MTTPTEPTATSAGLIGIWAIDPARSSISFTAPSRLGPQKGSFRAVAGELLADAAGLQGRMTIDASSLRTGLPTRDWHLRSGTYFDARHHPQIEVRSVAIAPSEPRSTVIADLRIRDTVLRIEAPVTVEMLDAETMRVDGDVRVPLAEFRFWNPLSIIRGDVDVHGQLTLARRVQ